MVINEKRERDLKDTQDNKLTGSDKQQTSVLQGSAVSPLERSSLDTLRNARRESPAKIEEAAKQLIIITSLSQTIYFASVSYSEARKGLDQLQSRLYWCFIAALILPLVAWILSLIFAIRVFKPETYETNLKSPSAAEAVLEKITNYKNRQLQVAYWLLVVGFLMVLLALFVYLVFLPSAVSVQVK
jgi:uncharacterized membrane protein